jgi:hypothetical protein
MILSKNQMEVKFDSHHKITQLPKSHTKTQKHSICNPITTYNDAMMIRSEPTQLATHYNQPQHQKSQSIDTRVRRKSPSSSSSPPTSTTAMSSWWAQLMQDHNQHSFIATDVNVTIIQDNAYGRSSCTSSEASSSVSVTQTAQKEVEDEKHVLSRWSSMSEKDHNMSSISSIRSSSSKRSIRQCGGGSSSSSSSSLQQPQRRPSGQHHQNNNNNNDDDEKVVRRQKNNSSSSSPPRYPQRRQYSQSTSSSKTKNTTTSSSSASPSSPCCVSMTPARSIVVKA